ncbi:MAG: YjbE family putative metal transport protein [Hyphomicrobiales bacterium]
MDLKVIFDFISIVLADIVLSGDNALIIGMAASSLSPELRKKAIAYGMAVAAILRIVFAVFATYLLEVKGLLFIGGLLLLWVSWRLYHEIIENRARAAAEAQAEAEEGGYQGPPRRTLTSALISITIADVSMSIDNVLAVAAIARDNTFLLVFGLALAIALMGFFATIIAKLLTKYPSISWAGLIVLIYVSLRMLWEGWPEVAVLTGLN